MKKLQSGRSMIEMLGVLAIIGVLSIGGLAAYNTAMERNRANELLYNASICLAEAATLEAVPADDDCNSRIDDVLDGLITIEDIGVDAAVTMNAVDGRYSADDIAAACLKVNARDAAAYGCGGNGA